MKSEMMGIEVVAFQAEVIVGLVGQTRLDLIISSVTEME